MVKEKRGVKIPTIDVHKQDLEELAGSKFTIEELDEALQYAKSEIDDYNGHELKIDVKATDRPDLWNVEGIARILRGYYTNNQGVPKYKVSKPQLVIDISEKVKKVRPYIAAAVIRNVEITEDVLRQLIQVQEKIAGTFGRRRREVAIGIFELDKIVPPLLYTAVKPDGLKFEPLGSGRDMTPAEILKLHPKGVEFGHLVKPFAHYPIIIDASKNVVSMPPIINSEHSGKVTTHSKDLLIEVTGLEMHNVEIALNILAMSLADRGGEIEQVRIVNSGGNAIVTPNFSTKQMKVDKSLIKQLVGYLPSNTDLKSLLKKARYNVLSIDKYEHGHIHIEYPSWRADIMHPIDVVEDVLISIGYNNIEPEYPVFVSQGYLTEETVRNKDLREIMIGTGAQEISTFILNNKDNLFKRMNLAEEQIVEIANPVSSNWSVLRNWLLPSVMEFLSRNTKVEYPQKVFEMGQCVRLNSRSETKTVDEWKLCYAEAGSVDFTRAKSVLQGFARAANFELEFVSRDYPSFIPGRSAEVKIGGKSVGIIGEIHPKILNNWKIGVPVVAWEILV